MFLYDMVTQTWARDPQAVYSEISWVIKKYTKYKIFQKELYNFERSYKFIQRTCTVF
jgi:hypothetical protein